MSAEVKQQSVVLDAYLAGCRTTREVSEITGLSIRHCSSYTRELCSCGVLVKTGNAKRWSKFGQQPYFYEPAAVRS